jgi:hypothetical protein
MHGGRSIEPYERLDVEGLQRVDIHADRGLPEHRFDIELKRNDVVSEPPGSDLTKELQRAFRGGERVRRDLAERLLRIVRRSPALLDAFSELFDPLHTRTSLVGQTGRPRFQARG